ncbi:uncharacterized protein [Physcomitrium patens]
MWASGGIYEIVENVECSALSLKWLREVPTLKFVTTVTLRFADVSESSFLVSLYITSDSPLTPYLPYSDGPHPTHFFNPLHSFKLSQSQALILCLLNSGLLYTCCLVVATDFLLFQAVLVPEASSVLCCCFRTFGIAYISLPISNGHALNVRKDTSGIQIDISGPDHEADGEADDQSMPGKTRAAEEPQSVFTSFKNVMFGSNTPHAPEMLGGDHDSSGVELSNENSSDFQHQEDPNETVPGSTNDSACHGPSEENSQEKIDFHPASEPQRLTVAFPSTPGHSSITQAAEDQSNPPTAHSTDSKVSSTNKSPSRPSSPFRQGQDEHIGSVHSIAGSGTQGDAVVIATNIRSASFQSAQGEHYQHQGQQSVLNPASHSQSQFLLTISAPSSQSGVSAAGGAQLEHLLARVKHEKTVLRALAWEESAKARAYNRYTRDESKITAWENTMKAKAEAKMRKAQEDLDKQRANHIEKMKNAVASVHCKAQEKRAAMEARRAEDIVKAEEIASRIRATGKMPRKCLCVSA